MFIYLSSNLPLATTQKCQDIVVACGRWVEPDGVSSENRSDNIDCIHFPGSNTSSAKGSS